MKAIQDSVDRILNEDVSIPWDDSQIREDLKRRMISYTGEEVSKPETLTLEQVIPGLPPEEHGGSVDIRDWLEGRSRYYIDHPAECILPDHGQFLPPLQAKVHVKKEDSLDFARMLVQRRICTWVKAEDVAVYRNEKVLSGMFGVQKKGRTSNNLPILRLIMNLIPANATLRPILGRVSRLPSICSWANIVVEANEIITVCQSDMQAAFYLFALPRSWSRLLCFNLSFRGEELGGPDFESSQRYYLACGVLPMGWSSAVGIMQCVAEEVLLRNGLPEENQVRAGRPLPRWLTQVGHKAAKEKRMWWHVYLDNYASGEKCLEDEEPIGGSWQVQVEDIWERAGIVCSKEKSVKDVSEAVELGAYVSGKSRWIGASPERIIKLVKTTWWLITRIVIPKKLLQVVMGRWIFILQFRRPGMSHFQKVWEAISRKRTMQLDGQIREELFMATLGVCLFHTFLGAEPEDGITCSDASTTGGGIAYAEKLTTAGINFLANQEEERKPVTVPVAVVSLFNGIGGAFRCYDLAGAQVVGGIAVEIHEPAQRVMSRIWPHIQQWGDIRTLDGDSLEECLEKIGQFDELHIWCGFPCVDLSSAKHGRKNLEGEGSGLIREAVRIIKVLKQRYHMKTIKRIIENVCSMDVSAREEISQMLGLLPYKLDPSSQVPMSRPRFCWTDVEIEETDQLWMEEHGGYVEIKVLSEWPSPEDWLDKDCPPAEDGVIYPTFMKSIPRLQPPPKPVGLHRCSQGTVSRWQSDDFRFPPYQYGDRYLIWDPHQDSYRLLSCEERERLMGLGAGITSYCKSASQAKQNRRGYQDERYSLIGSDQLRAQRRRSRKGISLEDRGIASSTRSRYFEAVRHVLPLLSQNGTEDEIISAWIEEQYLEGEAITTISDTLSGLHHFAPYLRNTLSKSWRLFRLWRRIEKPRQAPPLPPSFARGMVNRAIEVESLDLAVIISLGFWGMLRTGELIALFPCQVLTTHRQAVIQLGATKSGLRRNQDENVVVEDPATVILLQEWIQLRTQRCTLDLPAYPQGAQHFRDRFKEVLRFFKVEHTFRPYSLRRGGATTDFKAHGQMERTLIRGRWASTGAARQYIQEGLSELVKMKITEDQTRFEAPQGRNVEQGSGSLPPWGFHADMADITAASVDKALPEVDADDADVFCADFAN
eukprot:Skav222902  [mRNA]  locus=scaffold1489:76567:81134:+ [translate_table: standard]